MTTAQEVIGYSSTSGSVTGPATIESAIESALGDAILAPSTYNNQPWLFRVRGTTIDLLADRTRSLPVLDPFDRELVISCGAALYQLRLGLRRQGLTFTVAALPDPTEPDLLARVTLQDRWTPTTQEIALHAAISQRHTNRQPFLGMEVPAEMIAAFKLAALDEGAAFVPLLDEGARTRLVALVMEGDHQQWSDERFRCELAEWMRPDGDSRSDGLTGIAMSALPSVVVPSVVRTFDLGEDHATHDRDLADGSPLLAVIATASDTPADWLLAGQALARVLLLATVEGLGTSFLDQPVEDPDLRVMLDTMVPNPARTQVVLRMGYAPAAPATPRRPVAEVLR